MNRSEIFKKAHQIAKSTVAIVGNYSIAFSIALKEIYSNNTASIADKLLAAGGKVWEKDSMKRIYLNMSLVNALDLGINFNDKKHKLYFDLTTNRFDGSSKTFVQALNK